MALALDIFSWIAIIAGALCVVIGAFGLVRMPDFFTRLHPAGGDRYAWRRSDPAGFDLSGRVHLDRGEAVDDYSVPFLYQPDLLARHRPGGSGRRPKALIIQKQG